MAGYDLRVFPETEQQAILADILEDLSKLKAEIQQARIGQSELERQVKWLKYHMPEPDLRYMG